VLSGIQHRNELRMLQPLRKLYFAQKPVGTERLRELGSEHLDCHWLVVLDVAGEIHGCRCTATEFALDRIVSRDGARQTAWRGVHYDRIWTLGRISDEAMIALPPTPTRNPCAKRGV
jgi:hypothetical protein